MRVYHEKTVILRVFIVSITFISMFKEISYFRTLDQDLESLAKETATLDSIVAQAYTPPQQTFCSVDAQVQNIIQEEQHLQSTFQNITLAVNSNSFLPVSTSELPLYQIQPSLGSLPEWLPIVLQSEYSSKRNQLSARIMELFKAHQLQQKRKGLSDQRERLMGLQTRSQALSRSGISGIDLIQEASYLKDKIHHTRKVYENFCTQAAKIIISFVSSIISKGRDFGSSEKYVSSNIPYGFFHEQKQSQISRKLSPQRQLYQDYYSFQPLEAKKPERQMHSPYKKCAGYQKTKINQRSNFIIQRAKQEKSPRHYYDKVQDFTHDKIFYAHKQKSPVFANYQNHYHHRSPEIHKHTCSSNISGINRVNSAGKIGNLQQNHRTFNFRSVIGQSFHRFD